MREIKRNDSEKNKTGKYKSNIVGPIAHTVIQLMIQA